jgi:hypothetical protein
LAFHPVSASRRSTPLSRRQSPGGKCFSENNHDPQHRLLGLGGKNSGFCSFAASLPVTAPHLVGTPQQKKVAEKNQASASIKA